MSNFQMLRMVKEAVRQELEPVLGEVAKAVERIEEPLERALAALQELTDVQLLALFSDMERTIAFIRAVDPTLAGIYFFSWSRWIAPGETAILHYVVPKGWVNFRWRIAVELYTARMIDLTWLVDEVELYRDPEMTAYEFIFPPWLEIRKSCVVECTNTDTVNNWVKIRGISSLRADTLWEVIKEEYVSKLMKYVR